MPGARLIIRLPVPAAWRILDVGEGGFEASNFNAALAAEPTHPAAALELQRHAQPVSGKIGLPILPTVSFLLIDGDAELAG